MIIFQARVDAFLLLGFCHWALATSPFSMTWSSKTFGPDGPWNAVEVNIGSPGQRVALYPGGAWESKILLSDTCANVTLSAVCYANKAGVFDPEESSTWDNTSINFAPSAISGWQPYVMGGTNAVPVGALANRAFDSIDIGDRTTVPQSDLVGIMQASQTYPGGQEYPLQVGVLSLGAPTINHTFEIDADADKPDTNGTFITSWLWEKDVIASYSYGLHIGSPTVDIPGSLMLGGYDRNRVLGDVSAQPFLSDGSLPIQLLDIGLGVAGDGGSPWNFTSKTGLLAKDNSSLDTGTIVQASTADPYIYLPQSSCDSIAAELPLYYQPDYGLYFWNTSDPQYPKIILTPSFMSFTFSKNGLNNENMTINVPFALLSLTFEPPLIANPRKYFPCMGTNSTQALGRAFFQAAFIGVNWNQGTGNWFLAQAPGPGYSVTTDRSTIEASASTITGSSSSWEASWSQYWTNLPTVTDSNPHSNASGNESDDGLSTGAMAGIYTGSAIAAVLVIVLLVWLFFRPRRIVSNPKQQSATIASPFSGLAFGGNRLARSTDAYEVADKRYSRQLGPYEISDKREIQQRGPMRRGGPVRKVGGCL
ncbi:aspartic peptidase domain-containing protein [Aspergillus carlsbadensis]|nr:aspartic peptidase domain-containing protein [Aspergillus carlsbadensis]